ncbi:MAG: (2Fe-2S)-binding protein [Deltaproteobacteria bacterium]|nr:(2Fe-2S)-binding protein [Deltaproteobacteria bacterium]
MPTFKLDGQEIPFEPGDTIIRAAFRQGIEIPHYCWHPGLSIAANCRMCLVEIKSARPMLMPIVRWDDKQKKYVDATKPKLQPACQAMAAEGLEVFAKNEAAKAAQASTQEMLLLNHPVDCPICDQAGECRLQDYWQEHGARGKRMLDEPVHKPKGVVFGETIVYDAERCIMCTRCIRFMDEVAKDPVLDMRERGNRNEIVLSPGRELEGSYTLMTEHVCPVGALTSSDFRFKARVWFLRSQKSVCPGCATGCSEHVDYDPRTNEVARLRPRENLAVNKYWMCDEGMLLYEAAKKDRLLRPRIKNDDASHADAIAEAAKRLGKPGQGIAVVLSSQRNVEDNHVAVRLARDYLPGARTYWTGRPDGAADDILLSADRNPNRAGIAHVLGSSGQARGAEMPPGFDELVEDINAGRVTALLSLGGETPLEGAVLSPFAKLDTLVVISPFTTGLTERAHVALPCPVWYEEDGTFVQKGGLKQRYRKAFPPQGEVMPAWQILARLAGAMDLALAVGSLADIRREAKVTDADVAPLKDAPSQHMLPGTQVTT